MYIYDLYQKIYYKGYCTIQLFLKIQFFSVWPCLMTLDLLIYFLWIVKKYTTDISHKRVWIQNSGCISSFRHFLLCEGCCYSMCISLCFRGGNRATEDITSTYKSSSLLGLCTPTSMCPCAALYYYVLCQDVNPIKCLRMVWFVNLSRNDYRYWFSYLFKVVSMR